MANRTNIALGLFLIARVALADPFYLMTESAQQGSNGHRYDVYELVLPSQLKPLYRFHSVKRLEQVTILSGGHGSGHPILFAVAGGEVIFVSAPGKVTPLLKASTPPPVLTAFSPSEVIVVKANHEIVVLDTAGKERKLVDAGWATRALTGGLSEARAAGLVQADRLVVDGGSFRVRCRQGCPPCGSRAEATRDPRVSR